MNIITICRIITLSVLLLLDPYIAARSDITADLINSLNTISASFTDLTKALAQKDKDDEETPAEPVEPIEPEEPVEPIEDNFSELFQDLQNFTRIYRNISSELIEQAIHAGTSNDYLAILQSYADENLNIMPTLEYIISLIEPLIQLTLDQEKKDSLKSALEDLKTITHNNKETIEVAIKKLAELEISTNSAWAIALSANPYKDTNLYPKMRDPWNALGIKAKDATVESIQAAWEIKDKNAASIGDDVQREMLRTIRDYLANKLLPTMRAKELAKSNNETAKKLSLPDFNPPIMQIEGIIGNL